MSSLCLPLSLLSPYHYLPWWELLSMSRQNPLIYFHITQISRLWNIHSTGKPYKNHKTLQKCIQYFEALFRYVAMIKIVHCLPPDSQNSKKKKWNSQNMAIWRQNIIQPEGPVGPAGALRRRLLHRNGNFIPPAQWIRTRWRVKTVFVRQTGIYYIR